MDYQKRHGAYNAQFWEYLLSSIISQLGIELKDSIYLGHDYNRGILQLNIKTILQESGKEIFFYDYPGERWEDSKRNRIIEKQKKSLKTLDELIETKKKFELALVNVHELDRYPPTGLQRDDAYPTKNKELFDLPFLSKIHELVKDSGYLIIIDEAEVEKSNGESFEFIYSKKIKGSDFGRFSLGENFNLDGPGLYLDGLFVFEHKREFIVGRRNIDERWYISFTICRQKKRDESEYFFFVKNPLSIISEHSKNNESYIDYVVENYINKHSTSYIEQGLIVNIDVPGNYGIEWVEADYKAKNLKANLGKHTQYKLGDLINNEIDISYEMLGEIRKKSSDESDIGYFIVAGNPKIDRSGVHKRSYEEKTQIFSWRDKNKIPYLFGEIPQIIKMKGENFFFMKKFYVKENLILPEFLDFYLNELSICSNYLNSLKKDNYKDIPIFLISITRQKELLEKNKEFSNKVNELNRQIDLFRNESSTNPVKIEQLVNKMQTVIEAAQSTEEDKLRVEICGEESGRLEFKATLAHPIYRDKVKGIIFLDKDTDKTTLQILKGINALLNTKGGKLIVGILDGKEKFDKNGPPEIWGIEEELKKFGNRDKYLKFLSDQMKDSFQSNADEYIKREFKTVNGKTLLVINIKGGYKDKHGWFLWKERLGLPPYKRNGPSNQRVPFKDLVAKL